MNSDKDQQMPKTDKILDEISTFVEMARDRNVVEGNEIVAAILFGGAAREISRGCPNGFSDIDIIFLCQTHIVRGTQPFDHEALISLTSELTIGGCKLSIMINGAQPANAPTNRLTLDCLCDSIDNIHASDPNSVIDFAYRPRICIFGQDSYKEIERVPLTPELVGARLHRDRQYLTREYGDRQDPAALRAYAQVALYSLSLVDPVARHLNKASEILDRLLTTNPDWTSQIHKLELALWNSRRLSMYQVHPLLDWAFAQASSFKGDL